MGRTSVGQVSNIMRFAQLVSANASRGINLGTSSHN